jgi:hypothetical protein
VNGTSQANRRRLELSDPYYRDHPTRRRPLLRERILGNLLLRRRQIRPRIGH